MSESELEELANVPNPRKISKRDFATAARKGGQRRDHCCRDHVRCTEAGIKVFATGGIGGVHRESRFDISTDLQALASIPHDRGLCRCKSHPDLSATLEYLETMSVPVVGYQTDDFPAFYSRESGLKVSVRAGYTG